MISEDDERSLLFEKLLEMWDSEKLISHFRAEYKRGFDDGVKTQAVSRDDLQAEFERGRQSVVDEVKKMFPAPPATQKEEQKKPIAKSIVEISDEKFQEPAKVSDEGKAVHIAEKSLSGSAGGEKMPSEPDLPVKNVGGKPPKIPRPIGIPTNFEMARAALTELGPSSAPQIREFVRKRWWPSVSNDWSSVLWDFAKDGRLARDGINFTLSGSRTKLDPQATIDREVQKRTELKSVTAVRSSDGPKREVVTPGAKLGPPARGAGVEFKYAGKIVTMQQREVDIAVRLRAAMGSGHLDAKFLAQSIGVKYEAESYMKEFVSILNPKIAEVGLTVEFFKGYGFVMKEVV